MTPETPVADVIQAVHDNPPGNWPSGWASWDNVIEAHRQMATTFAESLRPDRTTYAFDRGVVIAGGGVRYLPSVWVNVNMLRYMGCELPIQLWYFGDAELDPYFERMLSVLGVECINAWDVHKTQPCRILCGWELKLYSTLYSPFQEVMFLDADNNVARDPTYLFDEPEYKKHGSVFWPDYDNWQLKEDVWTIFGSDWMVPHAKQERAFESGQYLINKGQCRNELLMSLWYAEHSDFTFKHVYGDKECFHLGWRRLQREYAMPTLSPGWDVHTIVQYDFQNQRVFHHRCQDKWKMNGNRFNASLPNEELLFEIMGTLKEMWSGVLWQNPRPTKAESAVIKQIHGKRFMYRRIGYDERHLILGEYNLVTEGSDECERRWDINEQRGEMVLTISRADRPTCHLRQDADGVWRGKWIEHEQMPIELVEVCDGGK